MIMQPQLYKILHSLIDIDIPRYVHTPSGITGGHNLKLRIPAFINAFKYTHMQLNSGIHCHQTLLMGAAGENNVTDKELL